MNDTILKLIKLITTLYGRPSEHIMARDMHYQIVLDYNSGKPTWFIEHDGKAWQMEQYCPASQNGFKTFKQAESVLTTVLLQVAREEIERQKTLKEIPEAKLTELEIEYLVLEIAS